MKMVYRQLSKTCPQLFYYDKKKEKFVFKDMSGNIIEKHCPLNENIDTYIGCALLICKLMFGSNTKFREFVDFYFKGKRPEELVEQIKEYELDEVLPALVKQQLSRKFEVGQRVLFIQNQKEKVGIITNINDNNSYNIENEEEAFYGVDVNYIIRKMRQPNKKKEN